MSFNYDQQAREDFQGNKNTCISWYLLSSYSYYCAYESLLQDTTYDRLCKYILENYERIEHHHKHLVDIEALRAGTGYQIKTYPLIVQSCAEGLIREMLSRRNME
ncbi:hypothetical protein D9M71_478310 [compost metagenome]